MVGLAFYRYLLKVEPIASASPETVCSIFGPRSDRPSESSVQARSEVTLPPNGKHSRNPVTR